MSDYRHIQYYNITSYDINITQDSEHEKTNLELPKHFTLFHDIPTIVTLQQQRFIAFNVKFALNRLVTVAYTRRISALDNIVDLFGQVNPLLLHDLIIPNDVDRCARRQQGDLVNFLRVHLSTLNLNYILRLEALAGHVDRDGDNPFLPPSYPQNLDNIQSMSPSNMVNNRAILNLGNTQLHLTHTKLPLTRTLYAANRDKKL